MDSPSRLHPASGDLQDSDMESVTAPELSKEPASVPDFEATIPVTKHNGDSVVCMQQEGNETECASTNMQPASSMGDDSKHLNLVKHSSSKCSYTTKDKVLFDSHLCENHDDDCDLEEKTLIVITMEGTKYHCSECDVWAQGDAFEEHLMCHIILRPYQCLYCCQCFINRREITRHVTKEHKGQKMNCALKALKRARSLMKAVHESGRYEFYARVAGKVPLGTDPSKDKNKVKNSKPGDESSDSSDRAISIAGESNSSTNSDDMHRLCESGSSESVNTESEKFNKEVCEGRHSSADIQQISTDGKERDSARGQASGDGEQGQCEDSDRGSPVDDVELIGMPIEDHSETAAESGSLERPSQSSTKDTDKKALTVPTPQVTEAVISADSAEKMKSVIPAVDSSAEVNDQIALGEGVTTDLTSEASLTADSPMETCETTGSAAETSASECCTKTAGVSDSADESGNRDESDMTDCVSDPKEEEADKEMCTSASTTQDEENSNSQCQDTDQHRVDDNAQKMEFTNFNGETVSAAPSSEECSHTETSETMEVDDSNAEILAGTNCNSSHLAETESEKNSTSTGNSDSVKHDQTEEKVSNRHSGNEEEGEFSSSNFQQSEEEESGMGLKIVAAFSLQEENSSESENSSSKAVNREKLASETHMSRSAETSQETSVPTSESQSSEPKDTHALALGPPSKPVPSSSFLEMSPNSHSVTSQGFSSHNPDEDFNYYSCGFACTFSCLTSREFLDHLMLDHAGEFLFSCVYCGYQSPSENGLYHHLVAHSFTYTNTAPLYMCGASACKYGSNMVAEFVAHQAWHEDSTVLHCHDCFEQFESVDDLLKHFEANFLQVINCPHCTAKATNRKAILNHMTYAHPDKPRMVSVAKQIICRDRKLNNYPTYLLQRNGISMPDSPANPSGTVTLTRPNQETDSDEAEINSRNRSLVSILREPIQPQERELTRQAAVSREMGKINFKLTDTDYDDELFDESFEEEEFGPQGDKEIMYVGSKIDEREIDNFKCKFCTFIARDQCRLEGHQRCHGLPPSRKSRFKCMYCPQSFNNVYKFNSHVSCHPGLITFTLYSCNRCEFDSNQRHIIVKHVRTTQDQAHLGYTTHEDDMFTAHNKTMESRVLECGQCSYMTRHRKHLAAHLKREHESPSKYPIYSVETSPPRAVEESMNHDHAVPVSVGNEGNVQENQFRRFKCPICQYLVPRAADLKAHVKRHSEVGEITLVMFRCKYCSAASTAREIIYGHLMEKHLGKQIALVKKIVKLDTRGNDNGYAVTSVDDEHGQNEAQAKSPGTVDRTVLLIPDSAGEDTSLKIECPCCSFESSDRQTIIHHVSSHHPEVSIMGRRQNNEVYPLDCSVSSPAVHMTLGESLQGEVLIVPDSQTFDEAVVCPKCDFSATSRRDMEQHLEENHPEVSVMGRNDYPTIDGKGREAVQANATGRDGMVIIGSGSLDEKIRCLYENYGDRMKCNICQAERPKKFFIHVHILRHLNILLWGCQYCSHKGLQKYKLMDHIKKVHPKKPACIRYLPVNVEERVNQYLHNASFIQAKRIGEEGDAPSSKNPVSGSLQFSASESDLNSLRLKHKAAQDNLTGCTIGSDELDMKLACLYSVGKDNRYHCVVCAQEFMRKFAVHRHIVQVHLNVNLIGCGYCDLESVERYIIVDHIMETHKSAPISMRNLAQNLENKVAEFLSQMTVAADAALDISTGDLNLDDDMNFKLPEPPQMPALQSPPAKASPQKTTFPSATVSSSNANKNQLNPNLLLLGKDSLNDHLERMFKVLHGPVLKYMCLVCRGVFDRKYAIHRHLLMKHLKAGIIGCPYCSFEGVERYQVFTHIKEDHKGAELRMVHLSVNLRAVVDTFMENLANGTLDLNSKTPPPWSMKRTPKKDGHLDEDSEGSFFKAPVDAQGLLVALGSSLKSSIKQEPVDEDDAFGQEPLDREMNGYAEADLADTDNYGVADEGDDSELPAMPMQSTSVTKTKLATDIQTDIRVITVKEKGFKRHICEKCKFTSLHRSNIVRHIYRVHEQYREQECPACNYKTLSRVLMEQHMQSEHPDVPFPQNLPARTLKRRVEISQEDQEYSLKKHKTASDAKQWDNTNPSSPNNSATQLYACAYCTFESMTHAEIVQHTRENHSLGEPMKGQEDSQQEEQTGGEGKEMETEDTEFESLVNTVKMNQVDLSTGTEDALWQCFYCSYKTSSEEDLKIHFADNHPGNVYKSKKIPTWRFVCRSCHVKTRAHSKMRYHLNRHINYRPYTCTTCGAFYPSPDQCRKHCRSNNHSETFTYVKIPRKEKRLQELIKECQELALALTRDPRESDTSGPSFSYPVPSKRKARKSCPSSRGFPSKSSKAVDDDPPYSPRIRSSPREDRTLKVDTSQCQMKCTSCDFTAQNVCDVWLHFIKAHEQQEFQWLDCSTGHICNEVGEISNAKEVPPMLEAPPGPGYSMLSNRMLSCHHCEFSTSTVQAMKSHLRCHLPKRYLCPYCSLRCSRRDTITQHVRCGHKGRELWTIFLCLPKGSEQEENVSGETEKSVDLDEPRVTFQVQEEGDGSPAAGSQVEKERDGSPTATVSSPVSVPSPVSERIQCGQCEMRLDNIASIYEHHNQDHPDLDFLWVDSTSGYTFNHSGQVIDARVHTPHLFTQDGFTVENDSGNVPTFCCKFCNFTSAYIQAIKSHMKSHLPHGFMCPYCCVTTNSKEKMMSHQSCVHRDRELWVLHLRITSEPTAAAMPSGVGEKNLPVVRRQCKAACYTCSKCDYSSENRYQYKLHLANHGSFSHVMKDMSKDVPFKCGYCMYVAEDEGDFGAHIASHLEHSSFRCSKCEFTAFERLAVQSHILSSHSESTDAEVIDFQVESNSEQGDSSEETQLVNLDPKVEVVPVSDVDLDREGLTLFSPAPSPENGGPVGRGDFQSENGDLGLEIANTAVQDSEPDDQPDSAEEDGIPRGGSSALSDSSPGVSASKGSILRLTLQGTLTGKYGIKRAVPVPLSKDSPRREASPKLRNTASLHPDLNSNAAEGKAEHLDLQDGERIIQLDEGEDVNNLGGDCNKHLHTETGSPKMDHQDDAGLQEQAAEEQT